MHNAYNYLSPFIHNIVSETLCFILQNTCMYYEKLRVILMKQYAVNNFRNKTEACIHHFKMVLFKLLKSM